MRPEEKKCTVMSFSCRLSNGKISASVIGNEKYQYWPKKALPVDLYS